MARAATTTDAFNAVAEPRRREILDLLSDGERSVNEIVAEIPVSQPQVSKHLKVLKEVGLVRSRTAGRQRLYRVDPLALKPIGDWLKDYELMWDERLNRLDGYLHEMQRKERE
ncbi:MAG TPA: metalloregulator ArsR/SmtB family transcription factor [Acidimicrobiia bacterium]